MQDRESNGCFSKGNQCSQGRPKGKSQKVMLREAQEKAINTLISAAHRGDVVAAAALLNYK